jgi:mono/diheme cytochrome c family protein
MAVAALAVAAAVSTARAQDALPTVAAGVYSDAQALRGAAAYDAACGRCHRQDLGGADGPALRDERFNGNFAGKDLRHLFTRIATTMPRGAPASMSEDAYLDILAYMLRENGFPSGPRELTVSSLDNVQVLPTQPKPLPPVGDFSYVQVTGCLQAGAAGWTLVNASEPVPAMAPAAWLDRKVPPEPKQVSPLGARTYHLVDALAYDAQSRLGQKLYVRGLLVRLPGEDKLTISEMEGMGRCE